MIRTNDSRCTATSLNSLVVAAVLSIPFFFACGTPEQKKAPAVLQETHQVERSARQAPYYPGLIEEYRLLVAEDPHNFAALVALGNAYFDNRDWKKAAEMYQKALAIAPHDADIRSALGTAYRNLGLIDQALSEYQLALRNDPVNLDARYYMGIVYAYDKKDYRDAVRVWQEILNLAPNYPEAERIRSTIAALNKKIKVQNR